MVVREVSGDEDLALVRRLMESYGAFLSGSPNGSANICLSGFREEMDGLRGRYSALLLATVDGVAAGCVALRGVRQSEGACEMKRLWVEPEFRGMRLGRRLVEEAIAWARREGMAGMHLETIAAVMPEANRLYAAMGFEREEAHRGDCSTNVEFFRLDL